MTLVVAMMQAVAAMAAGADYNLMFIINSLDNYISKYVYLLSLLLGEANAILVALSLIQPHGIVIMLQRHSQHICLISNCG